MPFTFATANEILFPIFLFFFYLGAVSLLFSSKPSQTLPGTLEVDQFSSQVTPPNQLEPELELTENLETESTNKQSHLPEIYDQAAAIIDSLKKRTARKLCAPLNIRQKTNGVEKSLTFMKAEIRSKFKEDPQQVIAVIQERLPDLFSNYSVAS